MLLVISTLHLWKWKLAKTCYIKQPLNVEALNWNPWKLKRRKHTKPKCLFILLLNVECRIPHSGLRIPQRTEPFRPIRCGFRIQRCGFRIPLCGCRIAICGQDSAWGTKKEVKIVLTFKNPIESHPMRNPHAESAKRAIVEKNNGFAFRIPRSMNRH